MIPLPWDDFSRKLENKAEHRTLHLGKVWYHVKSYVSFKFSTSLFSFLYPPSPDPRHCLSAWGRSYENTEALSDSKEEVKYCDKMACRAPWPPTHAARFWRNWLPCPCPAGFTKAVGLKSWMSVTEFFLRISLMWEHFNAQFCSQKESCEILQQGWSPNSGCLRPHLGFSSPYPFLLLGPIQYLTSLSSVVLCPRPRTDHFTLRGPWELYPIRTRLGSLKTRTIFIDSDKNNYTDPKTGILNSLLPLDVLPDGFW